MNKNSKIKNFLDVVAVMCLSLFIQFNVFAHNKIPTGSMIPTINIGDHIFSNRLVENFKDPTNGDIVTFRLNGEILIKRVIGKPNDIITINDGNVFVNGDKTKYNTIGSTYIPEHSNILYPYKLG